MFLKRNDRKIAYRDQIRANKLVEYAVKQLKKKLTDETTTRLSLETYTSDSSNYPR